MDVGASGRIQPVLAKVEPVLAREQRANLAHPQIVVRVAEGEEADCVPALDDEVEAKGYPDADHDPFPMAVDEIENAIQAMPRFKGFPAVAARGYRASGRPSMLSTLHPDRRAIPRPACPLRCQRRLRHGHRGGRLCHRRPAAPLAPADRQLPGLCVAVATGYFMHSTWSFKDHGAERHARHEAPRSSSSRIISYALNSFWVWLHLHAPRARTGGADHPDAVRDARRDLRSQPAVGFPLMERAVYEAMAEHDERHWWYRARREVVAALIRRKVHPPKGAQILEIGCGTGSQPSDARRVRLGRRAGGR